MEISQWKHMLCIETVTAKDLNEMLEDNKNNFKLINL